MPRPKGSTNNTTGGSDVGDIAPYFREFYRKHRDQLDIRSNDHLAGQLLFPWHSVLCWLQILSRYSFSRVTWCGWVLKRQKNQ